MENDDRLSMPESDRALRSSAATKRFGRLAWDCCREWSRRLGTLCSDAESLLGSQLHTRLDCAFCLRDLQ